MRDMDMAADEARSGEKKEELDKGFGPV